MDVSAIQVVVVDVGQGQCTFVMAWDTSAPAKLIHTLLFDCGTTKRSRNETAWNVQWIANTLGLMDVPTIDLLVFSHSDEDHISLMPELLADYSRTGRPALRILETWFAGDPQLYVVTDPGTRAEVNLLDELKNQGYCGSFRWPKFNESQFNRTTKTFDEVMWRSADGSVEVNMLVGNVISGWPGRFTGTGFGTSGEQKNRVSLVNRISFKGTDYIVCGDATNCTMGWVNWYFEGVSFPDVPMVTLPHHGSRSTGLKGKSTVTSDNARAIVTARTFAGVCNGQTVTVSAFAHHGHPSMDLASIFVPASLPVVKDSRLDTNSHAMVSYVDLPLQYQGGLRVGEDAYKTYFTQANLYGTFYYNVDHPTSFGYSYGRTYAVSNIPATRRAAPAPALNPHACWVYTSNGTGGGLYGVTFLNATAAPYGTVFTGATVTRSAAPPRVDVARPALRPAPTLGTPGLARLRKFR
jgi:hypothetical protein